MGNLRDSIDKLATGDEVMVGNNVSMHASTKWEAEPGVACPWTYRPARFLVSASRMRKTSGRWSATSSPTR